MRERGQDYYILHEQLLIEEQDADAVDGPLALLLDRIWTQANRLLSVQPDDFLEWLEKTAPGAVSEDAGTGSTDDRARLADVMDELDGVVLTALEEIARIEETEMTQPRAEEALKALWATTFTAVSAAREAWLEAAFIKRGVGVVETIYPDPAERRRLYHYGFTPLVGRRFDAVAAKIRAIIAGAEGYGDLEATARIDVFESIGALLQGFCKWA